MRGMENRGDGEMDSDYERKMTVQLENHGNPAFCDDEGLWVMEEERVHLLVGENERLRLWFESSCLDDHKSFFIISQSNHTPLSSFTTKQL